MLVFKLLCAQYSCSCRKRYKQAYYIFQFSVFLVKMVNHYTDYEDFLEIQRLLQEYILYHYFHHIFYETLIRFK